MSRRTKTIALDEDEKKMLDDAAQNLFETTEVPYGVVLRRLVEEHPNNLSELEEG